MAWRLGLESLLRQLCILGAHCPSRGATNVRRGQRTCQLDSLLPNEGRASECWSIERRRIRCQDLSQPPNQFRPDQADQTQQRFIVDDAPYDAVA